MSGLTHQEIWAAIDKLAARLGVTPSALARKAGLDPTSFNRSKRLGEADARPRWLSTESLSKVLAATGVSFVEFAALAQETQPPKRGVPLLGLAQAGIDGFFDEAGFPVGEGWEEVAFPGMAEEGCYALEITGDSMAPVYRDGDRIVVTPVTEPRRGDRVVVKTTDGEVMAKEVARITARTLELASLNPDYGPRVLDRKTIAWVARIIWASQ
ncbi:MAG TPA: helix-turn-helix transcriptional regulator [Caulobacteraceae bacterium]|nr:helix-turn-helix transcriptional regulator [Caulobacteraceae bacterium]